MNVYSIHAVQIPFVESKSISFVCFYTFLTKSEIDKIKQFKHDEF